MKNFVYSKENAMIDDSGQHFVIRPATEQDIDALIDLYIEFHEFHVRGVPDRLRIPKSYDRVGLSDSLKNIITDEDSTIFVAELDGVVVGLAEVYLRQSEADDAVVQRTYGHLQSLMVLEAYQHRGLGSRLTAAAELWASELGASELQLNAWEFEVGPLHFYEGLKYHTIKRLMAKDL